MVVGGLVDRRQHPTVAGIHLGHAEHSPLDVAHEVVRLSRRRQPGRNRLHHLVLDSLEQRHRQFVQAAEVVIEGRPGHPRALHQLVHAHLSVGAFGQQRLGGVQDLARGRLGRAANAAVGGGGCHPRTA